MTSVLLSLFLLAQGYLIPGRPRAAAGAGQAAADWIDGSGEIYAYYEFEEGSTPSASTAQESGQSLTWTNSPTQDGSVYVEGSYSISGTSADSDYLAGDASTAWYITGDVTYGGFVRGNTGDSGGWPVYAGDNQGDGFALKVGMGAGNPKCSIDPIGGGEEEYDDMLNSADTWYHFACTWSSANGIEIYQNGDPENDTQAYSARDAFSANGQRHMPRSNQLMNFNFDAFFFDDVEYTNAEVVYVGSCNGDGSLCWCDSTTPSDFRSCSSDTDCNGITGSCSTGMSSPECRGRYDDYFLFDVGNCTGSGTPYSCCTDVDTGTCGDDDPPISACNASAPS